MTPVAITILEALKLTDDPNSSEIAKDKDSLSNILISNFFEC